MEKNETVSPLQASHVKEAALRRIKHDNFSNSRSHSAEANKMSKKAKFILAIPLIIAALFLARDHLAYYLYYNSGLYLNALGFKPEKFPEILGESDFEKLSYVEKTYGFIGKDFQDKDLARLSLEFLAGQAFDSRTTWPEQEKRPAGFSPDEWLETGKDPGLHVRELHRQGITGKGISVAVIDKYINPDHQEFSARISYHPIETAAARKFQYRSHFHGIACASILCGKSCGVAPEAKLYYFAGPDDARNFYNFCQAME